MDDHHTTRPHTAEDDLETSSGPSTAVRVVLGVLAVVLVVVVLHLVGVVGP